ncbi:MAG: DUF4838 domain-containing protein [Acidobacteria bacterium]|nr:DUF4838 domain-containing protein [Acidobacteriota bacterium]
MTITRGGIGRSILLLSLVCAARVWAAPNQLALVRDGKSAYSICLSRNASPSEKRGAEELQKFLYEMSGARLPIVTDRENPRGNLVLVGNSRMLRRLGLNIPFDQLGPEGFALKTAGRHLVIAGGRERGTMYGAYAFLEKLGCRWFTPEVSRIPRMPTIAAGPFDETQKPAFEYREPFFTEAFDRDWAARNRTNGHYARLDESTGGKLQYYPFVHTFYQMITPEKYFQSHPEYFSLIDGARRAERGQLCLTNPEVLRLGVAAVTEWIRQHPEAAIYSVSQNDSEGWCECDNCRRVEQEEGGRHSGPILRFVNALAAEIEKRHPDKLIDTLAYWYSEEPPLKARPRRNVRIRLCPIGVCEAHPYEACPRSAYFLKNLRAWSKITDRLYIWHYNTNFSHYLLPFPDFDELAADIPMYRRYGVMGLFLEGAYPEGGGGENAELRSYVMARLLWDPNTDVNRAVDEFLEGCYGRAAAAMRAYFDLLHRQVRMPPQGNGLHIWINPVPDFSPDFLRQGGGLFRQAEAAAENEAVRRRVRQARLSIDYLELLRAKTYDVRGGWYAPADLTGLKQRFQAFLSQARSFGITSVHEGRGLEADEDEFAAYNQYLVATLENEAWRVELVPELSGRVIRMIDKHTGRDALRRVDSGEGGYPNAGGLGVFLYPDFHARAWETKLELDAKSGANELTLAGTCANGMRLRRKIRLQGNTVHTETIVENKGPEAMEAALQSRGEFDPGNIDDAVVAFRRQDGSRVEKRLIQPEQPPTGAETYNNAEQPDGEWRLVNSPAGLAMANRFGKEQVGRCALSWTAKGPYGVTFALWSAKHRLAPGESFRLEADYGRVD